MRSMAVTLWTFYPKRGSWELWARKKNDRNDRNKNIKIMI